ncbi:DUF3027 domain-containing protein [Paramicrobacterium chengjingii]|uniref:DUF3027 domain-containing protein n=1 Tax=Paramicrobacterium chengjingii TaxID=2769067 RepID=UPI001423C427|nr:DUF3027 domain-containing protein [Microbacterium chengjingii]
MPESNDEITPDDGAASEHTSTTRDAAVAPQREADPVLLDSVEFARGALHDVTDDDSVGAFVGHSVDDDNTVTLQFANTLDGYPGWFWTVTLARVDGGEPTILESELMPGDSALLAPDWVPWSERLAEYRAQQEDATREAAEADDAASDDDDSDDDDDDDETRRHLHAGDVDGVDVDEFDHDDAEAESAEDSRVDDGDQDDADQDDSEDDSTDDGSDEAHRGSRRGGARGRRRSRGRRRN